MPHYKGPHTLIVRVTQYRALIQYLRLCLYSATSEAAHIYRWRWGSCKFRVTATQPSRNSFVEFAAEWGLLWVAYWICISGIIILIWRYRIYSTWFYIGGRWGVEESVFEQKGTGLWAFTPKMSRIMLIYVCCRLMAMCARCVRISRYCLVAGRTFIDCGLDITLQLPVVVVNCYHYCNLCGSESGAVRPYGASGLIIYEPRKCQAL